MSIYEIPRSMVDPQRFPTPLMTSEPGSFAYNTFKTRVPRIIDEIVAANAFEPAIVRAMTGLRGEITDGRIEGLEEETPDREFWNAISKPWIGQSWLSAPWYWAESFFYRRVLQAVCYFQEGAWQRVDPYSPQKSLELQPSAAPRALMSVLRSLPTDEASSMRQLMYASLWGNRTDLSYNVANSVGLLQQPEEVANLLIDDSPAVCELLCSQSCHSLAVIADNAGTELLMDLALVDSLLAVPYMEKVILHLKSQPFFVSDAMPQDVLTSIRVLGASPEPLATLGARLMAYIRSGRLELRTHWFYTTSLFYYQMPPDLIADLARVDFVILKGDANYRRLLGDAHWPIDASFTKATAYFPTPLAALRTLKAELIVGLDESVGHQLDKEDPTWRINGRRGVVQSRI